MISRFSLPLLVCLIILTPSVAVCQDMVEFLSGAKVHGKVLEIRKEDRQFDFESKISGRSYTRTYTYSKVHAVTINGQRYEINKKPASPAAGRPDRHDAQSNRPTSSTGRRTESDIEQLIREIGGTPPDWYDSTPLEYPQSLDLSWPLKPPGKGWNNQKNMGQYIWDVINPNPSRWRSGVKLVHHIMTLHKNEPALLQRDMEALAGMYFRLFQDYPRAAFWFRKARASKGTPQGIKLAECYWRMGSKSMALEILNSRTVPASAIKLLGDMGETQRALQLVEGYARAGYPYQAYLMGGDACRTAGQHTQAIKYYERVLAASGARNADHEKRLKARAQESIEAIRLFDRADVSKVRDGTYRSATTGYNGALEVEVKVAYGRIESVEVIRHSEKQFYAALTDTPNQILQRQSVKGIDATSGATITSQAIVNATAKALAQGAN